MRARPFSSTTAVISGRIAAAIPHRHQAAEIDRQLRSYPPLWDLVQRAEMLELVLELAIADEVDDIK